MKRLTHGELADAQGRSQWAVLWEQALPLVKFAVKRLIKSGALAAEYATDDLLQEGNLAAGKVIRTWDPFEGAFSTWVIRRVSGALANHIARESSGLVGGRDAHGTAGSINDDYRIQTLYGAPAGFDDPSDEAERLQVSDRIRVAVSVLPAFQREVIIAVSGLGDSPISLRRFAKQTKTTFYAAQRAYAEGMATLNQNTAISG